MGSDAMPLRNLPCRSVPSAQGILHEADQHQESSVVFETSDDIRGVDSADLSLSRTLDEIVSQYAASTRASSPNDLQELDTMTHQQHGRPRTVQSFETFADGEDSE